MKFLTDLRERLSGSKFYILMALGVLASVAQFLVGIDLGMSELPPAQTVGDLIQQLYVFAMGVFARSAIAKAK